MPLFKSLTDSYFLKYDSTLWTCGFHLKSSLHSLSLSLYSPICLLCIFSSLEALFIEDKFQSELGLLEDFQGLSAYLILSCAIGFFPYV